MSVELVTAEKNQTTIKKAVWFKGFSAAHRKEGRVFFLPAGPNQGLVFKINHHVIPAEWPYLRRHHGLPTTILTNGQVDVRSVEHLLSAAYGLGVDNLTVELLCGSLPFLDFSAKSFVNVLLEAGLVELDEPRQVAKVTKTVRLETANGAFAVIQPNRGHRLVAETVADFPPPIGLQCCRYVEGRTIYEQEIAWARSFVRSPLDRGGSHWRRLRRLFPLLPEDPAVSPLIVHDERAFITKLATPDEPGRHELLDLIGDLTMLGHRLAADIRVYKPSHEFTGEIVTALAQRLSN